MEFESNQHLPWIDVAKCIAIFGVISIHVSGTVLYDYGKISNGFWWIGNIFDSIFRFSVPLFIMITGALLLSKAGHPANYYKHRFIRLIPPLIFWSFIYMLFHILLLLKNNNIDLNPDQIYSAVINCIKDGISPHFWFISMMIWIALVIPVIGAIIHYTGIKGGISLIVSWGMFLISKQFIPTIISCNRFTYFIGFIGLPLLGYYFSKNRFDYSGRLKLILTGLIVLSIIYTAVGTAFFTIKHNHFDERFYDYLSINVLLTTIGIFLLLLLLNIESTNGKAITRSISKHTYGIYFIHILVIWFLGKAGIDPYFIHPILGIPITIILCFVISFALIYYFNKIPFCKYISG